MRIIAGSHRGRSISAPKGQDTRPTLDRVRESLFNILQYRVAYSRVLDLFAGSGSLGFEALSRGAKNAVFNDASRECALLIRKNAGSLGFDDRAEILSFDYMAALKMLAAQGKKFDLVFLDPPYGSGAAQPAAEAILTLDLLAEDGMIVIEHGDAIRPAPIPGLMKQVDARRYGIVSLAFFQKEAEA